MIKSKAWQWEIVPKDDKYWNTPAAEIYYLCENWKEKGFKEFLDMGCGFGRNAIFMAKHGFNVTTFDLSEESVRVTKQKAAAEGVKLKDICVADMLKLPYADGSFDCLLAFNIISHTDKAGFQQTLNEILRVLKEGGEAYFTVCSKESFWYNNPKCIPVDDCTKIRVEDGPENGIPHFYVDDEDCKKLFGKYKIVALKLVKELTDKGSFSPHYHIWLKK